MYDLHHMHIESYPHISQLESRRVEVRRQLRLRQEIEAARTGVRPTRRRSLWRRRLQTA